MSNILISALILLAITLNAEAAPFAKGDAAAGKIIFDKHQCNSCHANILGGDGNSMFSRNDRKIKTASALATQITRCSVGLNLSLFEDEEENIGAYLNKNYYKFK
jgi:cytochrome c2